MPHGPSSNESVVLSKDIKIIEGCRYFNNGRSCWKGAACPFLHDDNARLQAINRRKAAAAELKQSKAFAVSHEGPEQKQNKEQKAETPNIPIARAQVPSLSDFQKASQTIPPGIEPPYRAPHEDAPLRTVEGCLLFNMGLPCWRSRKGRECQYRHDSELRAKNLAQKAKRNVAKKKVADSTLFTPISLNQNNDFAEGSSNNSEIRLSSISNATTNQSACTIPTTETQATLQGEGSRPEVTEVCRPWIKGYSCPKTKRGEKCLKAHDPQLRAKARKERKAARARRWSELHSALPTVQCPGPKELEVATTSVAALRLGSEKARQDTRCAPKESTISTSPRVGTDCLTQHKHVESVRIWSHNNHIEANKSGQSTTTVEVTQIDHMPEKSGILDLQNATSRISDQLRISSLRKAQRQDCTLENCVTKDCHHDDKARKASPSIKKEPGCQKRKGTSRKFIPFKDLQVSNGPNNLEFHATYSLAAKSSPNRKSVATSIVSNVLASLDQNVPSSQLHTQAWDPLTKQSWAERNLSPTALQKYLKPYGVVTRNDRAKTEVPGGERSSKLRRSKQGLKAQKSLIQFHLFPLLPYELQAEIWRYYIGIEEEQCIIALKRKESTDGKHCRLGFDRLSPLPTALAVNKYLRKVGLRYLELSFGTAHNRPKCYFNYSNHRLFICNSDPDDLFVSARALIRRERNRVRLLALPYRDWLKAFKPGRFENRRDGRIDFAKAISAFRNLRSLHLLIGDSKEDELYAHTADRELKQIQEFVFKAWGVNNAGTPMPNLHVQTIPAMIARQYKIDGLTW